MIGIPQRRAVIDKIGDAIFVIVLPAGISELVGVLVVLIRIENI